MANTLATMFLQDVPTAVQTSLKLQKPLFVYVTTGTDSMVHKFLAGLEPVRDQLTSAFVCLQIAKDLAEHKQLCQIVPSITAPSFTIVKGGKIEGFATESMLQNAFNALVRKCSPPLPPASVQTHMSDYRRHRHEQAAERERLRALIAADRRETRAAAVHRDAAPKKPARAAAGANPGTCVLSVRLLDGEMVKGEFAGDKTLMDVKRWIEHGQNVQLGADSASAHGMMAKPGFPEPTRIAFYSPGSRITYSEPQELCRLADLDLFPRLALILKPEYDEEIAAAQTKESLWRQTGGKMSTILLAVYSFFDYGVDEAQEDFQALTVTDEGAELMTHLAVPQESAVPIIQQPDESDNTEKVEAEPEMDFSLVGLTRKGTPAPSGTSRIHVDREDE